MQGQGHTLVLTGSRADRNELNERIREGLTQQGILNGMGDANRGAYCQGSDQGAGQRCGEYAEGDVVRFGKNYSSLQISKGEYSHVVELEPERHTIILKMEHGGRTVEWQPHDHPNVKVYRAEERTLQRRRLNPLDQE